MYETSNFLFAYEKLKIPYLKILFSCIGSNFVKYNGLIFQQRYCVGNMYEFIFCEEVFHNL